jgi:hypothetical protein
VLKKSTIVLTLFPSNLKDGKAILRAASQITQAALKVPENLACNIGAKMPRTNANIRTKRKNNSVAPQKRSRVQVKYRGPRISRTRLRDLREDLDSTREVMSDTVDNFWIDSEHDIRERLARTEQKIGRAVKVLAKAA